MNWIKRKLRNWLGVTDNARNIIKTTEALVDLSNKIIRDKNIK